MATKAKPDEIYIEHWIKRVLARTVRNERGCLIWQGFLTAKGYGETVFRLKTIRIHRKMYELVNKVKLTPDQFVCHSCDERRCCNVDHLWVGTNDDNQLDAWKKGRKRMQSATHCSKGHEYTPENTRRPPSTGRRHCLRCALIRNRIRAGWPKELAETLPVTPAGQRPVRGKFPRRKRQVAA